MARVYAAEEEVTLRSHHRARAAGSILAGGFLFPEIARPTDS
jgi:hypothetical protein